MVDFFLLRDLNIGQFCSNKFKYRSVLFYCSVTMRSGVPLVVFECDPHRLPGRNRMRICKRPSMVFPDHFMFSKGTQIHLFNFVLSLLKQRLRIVESLKGPALKIIITGSPILRWVHCSTWKRVWWGLIYQVLSHVPEHRRDPVWIHEKDREDPQQKVVERDWLSPGLRHYLE